MMVGNLLPHRPPFQFYGDEVAPRREVAMLAVPSRVAARLPHLSNHDIAEIDSEIRAAPSAIGGAQHDNGGLWIRA
jgi:phage terminase Nu1 subunit (DNA packaging protein)